MWGCCVAWPQKSVILLGFDAVWDRLCIVGLVFALDFYVHFGNCFCLIFALELSHPISLTPFIIEINSPKKIFWERASNARFLREWGEREQVKTGGLVFLVAERSDIVEVARRKFETQFWNTILWLWLTIAHNSSQMDGRLWIETLAIVIGSLENSGGSWRSGSRLNLGSWWWLGGGVFVLETRG